MLGRVLALFFSAFAYNYFIHELSLSWIFFQMVGKDCPNFNFVEIDKNRD